MLTLWDLVIEVLGDRKVTSSGASTGRPAAEQAKKIQPKYVDTIYSVFDNIDYVPYGMILPAAKAVLLIMEDNEAVIKMTNKGRSPTLRHVARVFRVDLDGLFERIRSEPNLFIKYINTKYQLADHLTKGSFTAVEWKRLMELSQLGPKDH